MWKQRYYDVLRGADGIKQICDGYQRECFHLRNRFMVDSCDLLIAVYIWTGKGRHGIHYQLRHEAGKRNRCYSPGYIGENGHSNEEWHRYIVTKQHRNGHEENASEWVRFFYPRTPGGEILKKVMGIDIETYSSAPLPKCGVYRYTDGADFEILLFPYAFDDEPVATVDLACGE